MIDHDDLFFDVEPPDAAIELVVRAHESEDPCPLWLGPARRPFPGDRLRFRIEPGGLAARDVARLARAEADEPSGLPLGIHLLVIPRATAVERVPEEVSERLRALGYLE